MTQESPVPQQTQTAAQRLQEETKKALAASKQIAEHAAESVKKAEEEGLKILKTFYSRVNGCTHYFKDGTVAKFLGGEFNAVFPHHVEELEALVKTPGNHLITDTPVAVQNPEGVTLLKEVGQSGGTGMVNTNKLGQ